MGFSISWVGVHGVDRAEVCERLGLRDTGEPDEFFETPFAGATSSTGWTVVISKNCDYFRNRDLLSSLSQGARIVAGCAEEHVMFSSSEEWRDGQRLWAVEHVGEGGDPTDLATHGNPPASLAGIREAMMKEQEGQEGVDFGFEIPLLLAKEIVGFKHDETGDRFAFMRLESLSRSPSKKGGLFGWLRG